MFAKETNLAAVKSEARALLYLDIKVEEKFGLFVQHPYFGQVIDAVQTNGKIEMVDLREAKGQAYRHMCLLRLSRDTSHISPIPEACQSFLCKGSIVAYPLASEMTLERYMTARTTSITTAT